MRIFLSRCPDRRWRLSARQWHQNENYISPSEGGHSQCSARSLGSSAAARSPSSILQDLDPEPKGSAKKLGAGSQFMRQLERSLQLKTAKDTVAELAAGGVVHANPTSGLVVINKPYGLPVHPAQDSPVSLVSCLPGLASHLGVGKMN